MPKSIWFPDEDYEQLVTLARQAGFRVSRGRGSQLRLFVMAAANNRVQRTGGESAANLSLFPAEVQSPAKVTAKSTRR